MNAHAYDALGRLRDDSEKVVHLHGFLRARHDADARHGAEEGARGYAHDALHHECHDLHVQVAKYFALYLTAVCSFRT